MAVRPTSVVTASHRNTAATWPIDQAEHEPDRGGHHPLAAEEPGAEADEGDGRQRGGEARHPPRRRGSARPGASGSAASASRGRRARRATPPRSAVANPGDPSAGPGSSDGDSAAHARAPENSTRRRSVELADVQQVTSSPTRCTPTCSAVVDDEHDLDHLRLELAEGALQLDERAAAPGHEHGHARVGRQRQRLAGAGEHVDRADLAPGRGRRGSAAPSCARRPAGRSTTVVSCSSMIARSASEAAPRWRLDVVLAAGVRPRASVSTTTSRGASAGCRGTAARAAGRLGRGAPVHVAAVVAGLVLAQCVEREVRTSTGPGSPRPRGRAAARRRGSRARR